jgi:predicted ATPase
MAGPSLDPLIGRDRELGALLEVVAGARLVTLTGAGGSGKTRLARSAVESLRAAGQQAWFVDCSAVHEAAIVGATIAGALDIEDVTGGDPIDAVVGSVGETDAVLALDNLEQIDGAGRVATRLLEAAPSLTVVATSRAPLRVRGEVEFAVAPLGLPSDATPDAIAASPAGELFLARAREVAPRATLDDSTSADVAALLERLDGLPLAIELAAARTRTVTPREILRRLAERGPEAIDTPDGDQHRSRSRRSRYVPASTSTSPKPSCPTSTSSTRPTRSSGLVWRSESSTFGRRRGSDSSRRSAPWHCGG